MSITAFFFTFLYIVEIYCSLDRSCVVFYGFLRLGPPCFTTLPRLCVPFPSQLFDDH